MAADAEPTSPAAPADQSAAPATAATPSPWAAMEVRPWLVLAGVLLLAAAAMTAFRISGWLRERHVIRAGPAVNAEVMYIGVSMARAGNRDEALRVLVHYTLPGGKLQEAWGDLPRKPGESIASQQIVPVHLDPDDLTYWTARDAPPPLGLVLAVPMLCVPTAAVCLAVAWLRQRRMRMLLQRAQRRAAHVITVKLSPLAPLSKLIGLTLDDDPSRRVLHCYWPGNLGPISAGDPVRLASDGKHALGPA